MERGEGEVKDRGRAIMKRRRRREGGEEGGGRERSALARWFCNKTSASSHKLHLDCIAFTLLFTLKPQS